MGRIDFNAINAAALGRLGQLAQRWAPTGNWDGEEWVACNPTRDDRKPGSFKINTRTGVWAEFATGEGGSDPISLYAYLFHNDNQGEAAKSLADDLNVQGELQEYSRSEAPARPKKQDETPPLIPVPDSAPPPPVDFYKRNQGRLPIVARWPYRDQAGDLLGYACRYEWIDEGETEKDVVVCRWVDGAWKFKGFPVPRPLYGLEDLKPTGNIIIVEGEKTRDAARKALPGTVSVLAWPGGGKAVSRVDWEPLRGRKVVLIPDADGPGYAAMEGWLNRRDEVKPGVFQFLQNVGAEVKIAAPDRDAPEGWDVADQEWKPGELLAWMKQRVRDPSPPEPMGDKKPEDEIPPATDEERGHTSGENSPPLDAYQDEAPHGHDDDGVPPPPSGPNGLDPFQGSDCTFRPLGYSNGGNGLVFHYLAKSGAQVVNLTPGQHTKTNLMTLAGLYYWESRFEGRGGFSIDKATNALFSAGYRAGIFDADTVRGRGAWWDNGRCVVHLGDRLIVDGETMEVDRFQSRHVYERGVRLQVESTGPMTTKEAYKLVEICGMICWEKPINARLFAGWIVCAAISGALKWRPHIWVTGGPGSGKSTILNEVAARTLRGMALFVQGETSEAGIRQTLRQDALPVLFDEAESERKQSEQRMDNIMALVTQASTESGAAIIKGSAGGAAVKYRARSCFGFASVGVQLKQAAARTRVTVLSVKHNKAPDAGEQFARFMYAIDETLTEEYSHKLLARLVSLIPTIRKNAEVFRSVSGKVMQSARLGDQYGTLLAGAFALHSNKEIDPEEARAFVEAQDWTEERSAVEEDGDDKSCLASILEYPIRVATSSGQIERTIGELIGGAAGVENAAPLDRDQCADTLSRFGIKLSPDRSKIIISNKHRALSNVLRETSWSSSWRLSLRRIPGAVQSEKPVRFSGGSVSRAVIIPLSSAFEVAGTNAAFSFDDDEEF